MFALILSVLLVSSSAMLLYQFWTRALVADGASDCEPAAGIEDLSPAAVLRVDTAA